MADGTYRRYGLDVTIVPGGPNDNNRMLLIAGKLDFFMAANTLMSFDAVANKVPVVAVAAVFQKDPQVLLTHPELKATKLEDLKPLTLFVSKEGMTSYFQWLKSEYGFSEKNVRPYNFNPQPFIATAQSAMQGYVTSEPYLGREERQLQAGNLPAGGLRLQLLFDPDRDPPRRDRQEAGSRAALCRCLHRRLVQLSLRRQFAPRNAMIKKLNPEMTDELLAYSIGKMKDYGIVDFGDSLKNGIGTMTDERVASFFDKMVRAGVVRSDIDYRKAYTLRFINKGVGLDLRPKN